MSTLFQISQDVLALQDLLLDDALDHGSDAMQTANALDAFMAELQTDQANKLDSYCGLIKQIESEAAVAKATAEQFQMKAKHRENAAQRLKDRLKEYLKATSQKKAKTTSGWDVSIVGNGGLMPLEIRTDVPIPKEFMKVITREEPDNAKIRKHLETEADPLPFACLHPRGDRLKIG